MSRSTVVRTAARKKKRQPRWEYLPALRLRSYRWHHDCGGGRWVNRPRRDFYENGGAE